jgi:hypothetical protein
LKLSVSTSVLLKCIWVDSDGRSENRVKGLLWEHPKSAGIRNSKYLIFITELLPDLSLKITNKPLLINN